MRYDLYDPIQLISMADAIYRRAIHKSRALAMPICEKVFGTKLLPNSVSALRSRNTECYVHDLGSDENVNIPAPTAFLDQVDRQRAFPYHGMVGSWRLPRPWYAKIKDVRLLGSLAVPFLADNMIASQNIVAENYNAWRTAVDVRAYLFNKIPVSRLPVIDIACSMVGLWSTSYFHWLVEYLPRLQFLQEIDRQQGRKSQLVVDASMPKWQVDSLRLMGYTPADLLPWNGRASFVRNLVIPAYPRRLCEPDRRFSMVSPSALKWLRSTVTSHLPSTGSAQAASFSERILISRGQAAGRRVVNEQELLNVLSKRGFVAYSLEDLSFEDQVRLFMGAKVVIGPHGAGLANMIFSQDLKVIELCGGPANASFFTLAASLGFNYGFLRCDDIWAPHPHRHNMRVNPAFMLSLLNSMDV